MRMKRMLAFLLMGILLLSCGCSANSSSFSLLNRKKTLELTEKGVSYWAQYLEQQEVGKPQDVVEQENHLSYLLQYPEIGKERIDARISEIVTEIRNAFENTLPKNILPANIPFCSVSIPKQISPTYPLFSLYREKIHNHLNF